MKVERFFIEDVVLFTPTKFGDNRGFFMETFRQDVIADALGSDVFFVQDNHSLSAAPFTVRGLHFQSPPKAQGKLVRCSRGEILDVAVDIRKDSDTYGKHVKVNLSAENGKQLYIPPGFLHGFVTLVENTEVQYKCSDYYSQAHEGSVFWDDPDLDIDWGINPDFAILSEKDLKAPHLKAFQSPF